MFKQEATWVAQAVKDVGNGGTIINLGSSTVHFRQVEQPWIEQELIAPLSVAGFEWVHADLKQADGVDVVADLMAPEGFAELSAHKPQVVLCCNILEHVADPQALLRKAYELLPADGALVVTVPYRYPYHADPIDTLYRPLPEEIAQLIPAATPLCGEILDCGGYWPTVIRKPHRLLDPILKLPQLLTQPQKYFYRLGRWSYLFRPYRVSAIVLKK